MSAHNRSLILNLVRESVEAGCRQSKACEAINISERRLQRWSSANGKEDLRRGPNTVPANKLTTTEIARIVDIAISKEYCDMSPHQIVPKLADQGIYVGSESSFYRVLKAKTLLTHRGRAKPKSIAKPRAHEALAPCKLFSWDITYLRSVVKGQYFYLYLFLDVFSRKIVGWDIHSEEAAEHSSDLLTKICKNENISKHTVSLHADNGSPMKGATMLVTMQHLGVTPSFSRPSVSNDNPYSEALFKTLKYCPQYPSKPFATVEEAKLWVAKFVDWYNTRHLHSAIRFTTPASRHNGEDIGILSRRAEVYKVAKEKNSNRWSKDIRNWERIKSVRLNWLKEDVISDSPAVPQTIVG